MENKTVLTIRETAQIFSFPEFAVRTLAKQGRFPVIQVGTRTYITRAAFEKYLQTGGELYDAKLIKK